jgi:hypothetical protein
VKKIWMKLCVFSILLGLTAGHIPRNALAETSSATDQLADYAGEIREANARPDGYKHLDTPAMIEKLKDLHANTYYYLIYHSPATDWDDLQNEFAPAAQAAGIQIVVYLVPPTETTSTQYSGPYKNDYVAWAKALANLSLQYPNLVSWAIDDFTLNLNTFTPTYLDAMKQAAKSINPNLMFTPQIYTVGLTPTFLQTRAAYFDGIIIAFRDDPHRNTQVWTSEQSQIDSAYQMLQPYNLPLYWMVYASRLSKTPAAPSAEYIDHVTQIALDNIKQGKLKGIITYVLQKDLTPGLEASDNRAYNGQGYLSLWVPGGNPTSAGQFVSASQTITPDGTGNETLTFQTMDEGPNVSGYHIKQLLVDNQVVWEQDTANTTIDNQWQSVTVDLKGALANKSSATLTLRLFEKKAVNNFYVAIGFDQLQPSGFTLKDSDFESNTVWTLSTNPNLIGNVSLYDPNRRANAYNAVKNNYLIFSDATPPVTIANLNHSPGDGQNGWYMSPVNVDLAATDDASGVAATYYALDNGAEQAGTSVDVTTEGQHSVTYWSVDRAGNEEQKHTLTVNMDKTAPTVTYSVYSGAVYTIDQMIDIKCEATDALSGVASTTCENITGPAYSFGLGNHTYSATATDNAGNIGDGSTSFTVKVTLESLIRLLQQIFAQNGGNNNGIMQSLEAKIMAAMLSESKGNLNARNHILDAFQNEVSAQSGKSLTAEQAEILKSLVLSLNN